MNINIDSYGRPQRHKNFQNETDVPQPYEVDASSGTQTYIRYSADTECAIRRITDGTTTKIECAFGPWADRATLTYQEANRPLLIPEEKVSTLYR